MNSTAPAILFCFLLFLGLCNAQSPCSGVTMVSRKQWGARNAKSPARMRTPVSRVIIHHTAGASCSTRASCIRVMRSIQNYHMDSKKWSDIGYSFLIGGDGSVYEGRGWNLVGAHARNFNSKSIGISFMGNFEISRPPVVMLDAARKLIDCGVKKGFITRSRKISGHRDANCTKCPGKNLYQLIQTWPGFQKGPLPGFLC